MKSYHTLDLEEAAEPPDLEDRLANDDTDNEDVPPLDTGVGAFGGVAVNTLTHDNVLLLVLNLGQELGETLDCTAQNWLAKLLATCLRVE
jgi:hypothetical protein